MKLLEVDSFKRWPKKSIAIQMWGQGYYRIFYYCPDKCVNLVLLLAEECLFVLLYIARPRGITSTIAIAIGPRHVYKGAKNKFVAQKKMIVSFLFVLKF